MAKQSANNPRNFLNDGFDLPKLEEKVLAYWDEKKIFEKSLAATKKGEPYVFYEGPPYANGKPGIHHVLARVVKDVMLRYKTMRGYHVARKAGWDTHGLPVEMAAEKALGLKSKRDIEKFGVKRFNEKAKEQVWIYKDEWERLTRRIGYWLDLKDAYVTYAPEYIETIWWTLAQIYRRKLLYKGHKVVPWCPRCGTALSSHELAQGYQEVVDNSVFIKFKLKPGQRIANFVTDDATSVLSWTTTPWTLPGNVALAVGENINYAFVRTTAPDRASYLVAKDLAAEIFKDSDFAVLGEIPGRRLVGLAYQPLFNVKPLQTDAAHKIYPASFVTTTEGTGVVHTAVMYGEDDYALGKKVGLPEFHTVSEEGKFVDEVPGLAGDYVKAKNTEEKIFEYMRGRGNLFRIVPFKHEYPHCWRCGTAVLYYARDSWFIAMSKLRKQLLAQNKKINWMPQHVKKGRFGEWLHEAKDWNLSRERYWGAPLPIWECKKCGHTAAIDGLDSLSKLVGPAQNRYWVMRHGEAEHNVLGILDSGPRNSPLTPKGKKEVAREAKRLKKAGIDVIISSEVMRAKLTAEIVKKELGVKHLHFDKRLNEIFFGPKFEGGPVRAYWTAYPTHEERYEKRPPGGESLRDVRARAWQLLKDCEKKYSGKKILFVSHGDPIIMMIEAATGLSEKKTVADYLESRGMLHSLYPKKGVPRAMHVRWGPRDETGGLDLHRPFVDGVTAVCRECDGGTMHRVREVADVWYDSGAMPLAQAHFPFEPDAAHTAAMKATQKSAAIPKPQKFIAYPADYIAEGMDQTRGWFYTMLAIATALGYGAPYRNVITFGLINDKFGHKMSKSKGNIVEPFSVIDTYGVDAVRWYFYSGTPFGEPKNFDEQDIAKTLRKTHLIIYNSFVFWKTYAAPDGTDPVGAPMMSAPKSRNILDQWILSRLAELLAAATKKLDHYEIREAAIEIDAFADDLSRWYIRRSRRRLQKPEHASDYRSASATLGYVLLALATVMAPFTPFFSEVMYAALRGKKESVHLEPWPTRGTPVRAPQSAPTLNKSLNASMAAVRELAALGLARRAEAGVKVRQPLASLAVGVSLPEPLKKILAEEVNVKKILMKQTLKNGVELDLAVTPELRAEGILREVARMVQELRQKANLAPRDRIALFIEGAPALHEILRAHEGALKLDVGARSIEYKRSSRFTAEEETKFEGETIWIGLQKA